MLKLLHKFKEFFDGTIGTWKTYLVEFELKENVTPIWSQPYPVPKVHEEILKKEVWHLVLLGVFELENDSEWRASYFAQPKPKSNRVCFLSEFSNLNKQLKQKPYPMPNINEMLLNLEGFRYATLLGLNMGYYHIWLSKNASNLCMIILPWGKYWYKCLPMGVDNSPYIFQ